MYFSLTLEREDYLPVSDRTILTRKNTYNDWFLIPTSRPVVSPPEQKRDVIDIPYSDGSLDMSTALNGYPIYENRTGSFQFLVENGHKPWYEIYDDILKFIHGHKFKVFLEEEPDWYYYGTLSIDEWSSEERYSTITINYDFEPYRKFIRKSDEDFEWDIFNFNTGVDYAKIFVMEPTNEWTRVGFIAPVLNEGYYIYNLQSLLGSKPVISDFVLYVTVKAGAEKHAKVSCRFRNTEITSENALYSSRENLEGSYTNPGFIKFTNLSMMKDVYPIYANSKIDTSTFNEMISSMFYFYLDFKDPDPDPMSIVRLSFRMEKI